MRTRNPLLCARANNVAIQNPQSLRLGPDGLPLSRSSLPPTLESSGVNQCARQPGDYACGRGGTECCGPFQNNSCFPGAYASYYELVDRHGIKVDRAPTSLAEDAHGHITVKPGIPAKSP